MSKVVKGVFKVAKKIVKGVGKVFKKIVTSKLFKVALTAVAIYAGGSALLAWGKTAVAGTAAGVGTASTVASTAATGTAAGIAASASPTIITSALPALAPQIATTAGIGSTVAATGAATGGFFTKALTFMQSNPNLTSMAFQGISSAFAPDEEDLITARGEQDRALLQEQERLRKERFSSLSGIGDLKQRVSPGESILRSNDGTPWHERLTANRGG